MTRNIDAVLRVSPADGRWYVDIPEFNLRVDLPASRQSSDLRNRLNDAVAPHVPAGTDFVIKMAPE
ncbi:MULTISPECIES: hypothetical protein [unclassified Actinoplanes]|uniref:hypothetical protein n=1 Tax=unclassified Actinoplanes TaxID=2626549 RepID=UPI0012BA8458|nr:MULTISPECIES: hypothetical protein [unclassified Actinoplanes]